MEVLLRVGVALAAGALFRMLAVFGLPAPVCLLLLAAAGAALSYKLIASRVFVVLGIIFGHFVAFLMTHEAGLADVSENPSAGLLALNSAAIFLPLAMPALGSMLVMQFEKRQARIAAETAELTEDTLLAEKIPQVKEVEIDYDSILARATDPEEASPSPVHGAGSGDSAFPSRG